MLDERCTSADERRLNRFAGESTVAKPGGPVHPLGMASVQTELGKVGVIEAGSGERTPLAFLHGVGSDKSVWAPQLEHFGRSRRTVAFDYPGYGDSRFRDDATRDDYAAAVLAAMTALGIGKAHICGLSLGGVVAIAMHAAAPERCASLVLADTFAVHPAGPGHLRPLNRGEPRHARPRRSPASAHCWCPRMPRFAETSSTRWRRSNLRPIASGRAPSGSRTRRERTSAIRIPTLILVGDQDAITSPALSEELASLIPHARLGVIDGASHLANLDKPVEFNRSIEDFLSAVEA